MLSQPCRYVPTRWSLAPRARSGGPVQGSPARRPSPSAPPEGQPVGIFSRRTNQTQEVGVYSACRACVGNSKNSLGS
eukprot:1438707-Pyramimonas_sp.AAC.1